MNCGPEISAGAVYKPFGEMLPITGLIDQVTAVLEVPVLSRTPLFLRPPGNLTC